MPKISFTHCITEKRNFGKEIVNQSMELIVTFEPEDDSVSVDAVNIYQEGKLIAEISKLLHKGEGEPLNAMVDAIDWRQQYEEYKTDLQQHKADVVNENY